MFVLFLPPISTLIFVVIFERASDIEHLGLAFGVVSSIQHLRYQMGGVGCLHSIQALYFFCITRSSAFGFGFGRPSQSQCGHTHTQTQIASTVPFTHGLSSSSWSPAAGREEDG